MHGKVERKIRQIKESIQKKNHERATINTSMGDSSCWNLEFHQQYTFSNWKHNWWPWKSRLDNTESITAWTEQRPTSKGPLTVSNNPKTFFKCNEEIFNAWFENWLITHVPKLMHQPKWYDNKRDVKEDDVLLFLKNDGALKSTYQFGKIKEIEWSQDNRIRKVTITYRNQNESRNTTRCMTYSNDSSCWRNKYSYQTWRNCDNRLYVVPDLFKMLIFHKILGVV